MVDWLNLFILHVFLLVEDGFLAMCHDVQLRYSCFVLCFILSGPAVKPKWKNRRDNYSKRKNNLRKAKKSGAGAVDQRRIKGKFFDMMSFLDPYLGGQK